MAEINNVTVLKGKEAMDYLVKHAFEEVTSLSREELESRYVNIVKLRCDMWKESLDLHRRIKKLERAIKKKNAIIKKQNTESLLKQKQLSMPEGRMANHNNKQQNNPSIDNHNKERLSSLESMPFLFSDTGMKFYQIRERGRQVILVQSNSENDKPSIPHRNDISVSKTKPVTNGSNWCLDRCVGMIQLTNTGTVFPDSDYDYVEVKPSFERVVSEDEGYPPEWIKTRRLSQHVDILYPFKHPMEELNKLVGCDNIKKRLIEFKSLAEYNKACMRQSPEYPVMQIFLHSIFYGNPGTGKSTVCRLYGSLLKETGLLSKGHVVVADRKVFTGDCFGDTEDILRELIKYSEGGILLFDEAYLLEGTHPNDPNKMVLPLLLSELADNSKKDFAVVLSGYKDKLDRMLEQNPGLYSRFTNRFEFKDYSLDELVEIGFRYLKTVGHTFTIDGLSSFRDELASAMSGSSKKTWANARTVKNMIEQIYIKRAMRYGKDEKLDREITSEDIVGIPYERGRRIGFSS